MTKVQTRNGKAILTEVSRWVTREGLSTKQGHMLARMCIQCVYTESGMLIYANSGNAESLRLPHDAVGHDHASVGLYQQQVPGWGTTADCMDPAKSTAKFLNAVKSQGLLGYVGPPLAQRIQSVQRSAYADGSNYAANRVRALVFTKLHWITSRRAAK